MKILIRIDYNSKEIETEIENFCSKIANKKGCIELDTLQNGNRTEYKNKCED